MKAAILTLSFVLAIGGCRKSKSQLSTPIDMKSAVQRICPGHLSEIDKFLEHGTGLIWIRFDVDQETSVGIQKEIVSNCGLKETNSSALVAKNHAESITRYSEMSLDEWIPRGYSLESGYSGGSSSLAIYTSKNEVTDEVILIFSSSGK